MREHPAKLRIADFSYDLPESFIAQQPLEQREQARLLVYKAGEITHTHFSLLSQHLPTDAQLLFNNTRVVRARLLFPKSSGAVVELFCLEPWAPTRELTAAMAQTGQSSWLCLVGNSRRWKTDELRIEAGNIVLTATRGEKINDASVVHFRWTPEKLTFAELLEQLGHIPLPPYMKRPDTAADAERYQTVFARYDGSVAAPTASLHFSERLLQQCADKGIKSSYLTLHVGAGTFKPVKSDTMGEHPMHREEMVVDADFIAQILAQKGPRIAVGTTALRCLESLYWLGCLIDQLQLKPGQELPEIEQFTPYDNQGHLSTTAALLTLQQWLADSGQKKLIAYTALMIAPGFKFRLASGLITNFHQPQSTLLLLVAAALGPDWRKVYTTALAHQYRFLSYGDGSLLWIAPENCL
jgi:S-adenosylmethionine:tRNA ribosyltransferase-isomerase